MNLFKRIILTVFLLTFSLYFQACGEGPSSEPTIKDYVRTKVENGKGSATIATKTFEAPGKPTIVLVGASHVGTQSFFDRHQEILEPLSVVLHEMAYKWNAKPYQDACDDLLRLSGANVEADTGLKEQYSYMDYRRPNFRKTDLANDAMIARYMPQHLRDLTKRDVCDRELAHLLRENRHCAFQQDSIDCLKDVVKNKKGKVNYNEVHKSIVRDMESDVDMSKTFGEFNDFALRQREEHVIGAIRNIIANENQQSIGILFGAAHMPPFEKFLRKEFGYKLVREEWIEAVSFRD